MVIRVDEQGTIYENSPKKTRADVRHEFIPEIKVASRILSEPETLDKLKGVSERLRKVDGPSTGLSSPQEQASRLKSRPKRKLDTTEISASSPIVDSRMDSNVHSPDLVGNIDRGRLLLTKTSRFKYYVLDDDPRGDSRENGRWAWLRNCLSCCWPR